MTASWIKCRTYWRFLGRGLACCFIKVKLTGRTVFYESLCGRHVLNGSSHGTCCKRPPAYARCMQCDLGEMAIMGKEESLPESKDWSQ